MNAYMLCEVQAYCVCRLMYYVLIIIQLLLMFLSCLLPHPDESLVSKVCLWRSLSLHVSLSNNCLFVGLERYGEPWSPVVRHEVGNVVCCCAYHSYLFLFILCILFILFSYLTPIFFLSLQWTVLNLCCRENGVFTALLFCDLSSQMLCHQGVNQLTS